MTESHNTNALNDFDLPAPHTGRVIFSKGKDITESFSSINIFKLRKRSIFLERNITQHRIHVDNTEMILVKDDSSAEWYLKMTKYGPQNHCAAITLLRSKCNYGGYREWFECPDCKKRAGVLYLDEDNFSCRKCLELGYWSQKMNYRSAVQPTLRAMIKLKEMPLKDKIYHQYHNGKLTRRGMRYEKLKAKIAWGTEIMSQKKIKP